MLGSILLALTVAVTVDDLPLAGAEQGSNGSTAQLVSVNKAIVETLKKRRIPAIGFVNEVRLEVNGKVDPERTAALAGWLTGGLELGNHTYSHPSLHKVSRPTYETDILNGERVLRPLISKHGGTLRWFRHPYLQTGRDLETKRGVEAFLTEHGYRVAPVTIDNGEWIFSRAYSRAKKAERKKIADEYVAYMDRKTDYWERSARHLFGRDIPQVLLVHANTLNADHLDRIVAMLEKRGYRFVTLETAVADAAYQSPDTFVGGGGISWLHRWTLTKSGREAVLPDEPEVPTWVKQAANIASE